MHTNLERDPSVVAHERRLKQRCFLDKTSNSLRTQSAHKNYIWSDILLQQDKMNNHPTTVTSMDLTHRGLNDYLFHGKINMKILLTVFIHLA